MHPLDIHNANADDIFLKPLPFLRVKGNHRQLSISSAQRPADSDVPSLVKGAALGIALQGILLGMIYSHSYRYFQIFNESDPRLYIALVGFGVAVNTAQMIMCIWRIPTPLAAVIQLPTSDRERRRWQGQSTVSPYGYP